MYAASEPVSHKKIIHARIMLGMHQRTHLVKENHYARVIVTTYILTHWKKHDTVWWTRSYSQALLGIYKVFLLH